MAITLLTAKSGVDGATLTSGAGGNSDFDSVIVTGTTPGTATVRLNWPTTGQRGARFAGTGNSGNLYGQEALSASDTVKLEIPFRHEAAPTAEANAIWMGNGATRQLLIGVATTGNLRVRDAAAAAVSGGLMTAAIPTATSNHVILLFVNRATGVVKVQLWLRGGASPVTNGTLSLTGVSLGSLNFTSLRLGSKASTSTTAYDATYGEVIIDTAATDIGLPSWLGPPVMDTTPTPSFYEFVDLSGTTVTTGPVAYTASPSTGVVGTSTGIFLPASTTVDIDYTITATDTGIAPPNTSTLEWTVDAVSGSAVARQRLRIYNGTILA